MTHKSKPLRNTYWYVLNIIARKDQHPEHYIKAINNLRAIDPMINVWREKQVSLEKIIEGDILPNKIPEWIVLKLISYTIIDKDSFYNRKNHTKVDINWDNDTVANLKESDVIFFPECHKLAVKKNDNICFGHIKKYFKEALQIIEPNGFDVETVVSKDFITTILQANSIIRFNANISFSNPNHSKECANFLTLLDQNLKQMNADESEFHFVGSKNSPLQKGNMLEALTKIAETNGSVTACIQKEPDGKFLTVSSKDYPRINTNTQTLGYIIKGLPETFRKIIS